MKTTSLLLAVLAFASPALPLSAHVAGHGKNEQGISAPQGGRLLRHVQPNAEFLVTPERKVQITFLDQTGKAIAPTGQQVTVYTGRRTAPVKLAFTPSGNALLSDSTVPEGDDFPTVVQIKVSADAPVVTEKFNLILTECGECHLPEYACICGH